MGGRGIDSLMLVYEEKKFLPYTDEQMYSLVQAVEFYPEFLPWCAGTRVRERNVDERGDYMIADVIVGFKGISERYSCRVDLKPDVPRIDIDYIDGPFKHLYNHWHFISADGGCMVDFRIEFEFKSKIMSGILSPFFSDVARQMVLAFEDRAKTEFG